MQHPHCQAQHGGAAAAAAAASTDSCEDRGAAAIAARISTFCCLHCVFLCPVRCECTRRSSVRTAVRRELPYNLLSCVLMSLWMQLLVVMFRVGVGNPAVGSCVRLSASQSDSAFRLLSRLTCSCLPACAAELQVQDSASQLAIITSSRLSPQRARFIVRIPARISHQPARRQLHSAIRSLRSSAFSTSSSSHPFIRILHRHHHDVSGELSSAEGA
jgi:hypothetical protein